MVSRNFFRFNTTNIISAETDNEDILDEAVEWCDRYELLFSRVDPASELFRLNSAEGRPTAVDAELAAFIETALSYCREVDGLFDVTMGSATQLWNFKDCMIPARDDVAAALRHVDYRGVIVNDAVVTLRSHSSYFLSCLYRCGNRFVYFYFLGNIVLLSFFHKR